MRRMALRDSALAGINGYAPIIYSIEHHCARWFTSRDGPVLHAGSRRSRKAAYGRVPPGSGRRDRDAIGRVESAPKLPAAEPLPIFRQPRNTAFEMSSNPQFVMEFRWGGSLKARH